MVVGARTFTGDVLARLGLVNAFGAGPERYPHVEVARIRAAAPDLVLLPDEPYPFTAADGPEEFGGHRVVLLPGRLLTWYGPSLATARADLLSLIREGALWRGGEVQVGHAVVVDLDARPLPGGRLGASMTPSRLMNSCTRIAPTFPPLALVPVKRLCPCKAG
jgi:hypothetical protein